MTKQKWIALAMVLLLPMKAYGGSSSTNPLTCRQVIQAADKAIADQKKEIQIRDLRIADDEKAISALQMDISEMAKKAAEPAPFYKSPILWFAIGIGVSAYLIKR